MKKTHRRLALMGLAAGVALTLSAGVVISQDGQAVDAAFAEIMKKFGEPGPEHQALEPLVGDFKLAGKWRMAPDQPWEEFEATSEREWILEGRFVSENVESEMMGMPFKGHGMIGYDRFAEQYTSIWMENMGTGTQVGHGKKGDERAIATEGTFADPMTEQKERWFKSLWKIEDENSHVYEMHVKGEDGAEFTAVEITYTRTR